LCRGHAGLNDELAPLELAQAAAPAKTLKAASALSRLILTARHSWSSFVAPPASI
jgi:hypothetical protein